MSDRLTIWCAPVYGGPSAWSGSPKSPERDTPADPGQERVGAAGSGVRKVVDARALQNAAAVAEGEPALI
jgi:hypothetical protein